ncbi:MAG TPA: hypothetical protein VIZ59_08055, partial [Rubrobacteraceae bacterium]
MKEGQHSGEEDQLGRTGVPRWPAAVALLAVGALYAVLSEALSIGPRLFLLAFVAILLVPLTTAHLRGSHLLARRISLGVIGFVTV